MRTVITVVLLVLGLLLLGVGLFTAVCPDLFFGLVQPGFDLYPDFYETELSAFKGGGIAVAAIGGVLALIGIIRLSRKGGNRNDGGQ